MEVIDFNQAFGSWKTKENSLGRFKLDSYFKVLNREGLEICQVTSLCQVRAANVYGGHPLFYEPGFIYKAAFSDQLVKIFRIGKDGNQDNSIQKISEKFQWFKVDLPQTKAKKLESPIEIKRAIEQGKHLTALITIGKKHKKYLVYFPVVHINYSFDLNKFQLETGPVLWPDLNKDVDYLGSAIIAYLAFNDLNSLSVAKASVTLKSESRQMVLSDSEEVNIKIKLLAY